MAGAVTAVVTIFVMATIQAYLRIRRPRITVEDAQEWIKGMLQDERLRVMDTIQKYKELGEIALSYQKAAQPQGEEGQSKKEVGSDQRN